MKATIWLDVWPWHRPHQVVACANPALLSTGDEFARQREQGMRRYKFEVELPIVSEAIYQHGEEVKGG